MHRTLTLVVSPTGETTLTARGYAGGDCLAASRFLEAALGTVAAERKTAEYFQAQAQPQSQSQELSP
jgi:hypothetical protein